MLSWKLQPMDQWIVGTEVVKLWSSFNARRAMSSLGIRVLRVCRMENGIATYPLATVILASAGLSVAAARTFYEHTQRILAMPFPFETIHPFIGRLRHFQATSVIPLSRLPVPNVA